MSTGGSRTEEREGSWREGEGREIPPKAKTRDEAGRAGGETGEIVKRGVVSRRDGYSAPLSFSSSRFSFIPSTLPPSRPISRLFPPLVYLLLAPSVCASEEESARRRRKEEEEERNNAPILSASPACFPSAPPTTGSNERHLRSLRCSSLDEAQLALCFVLPVRPTLSCVQRFLLVQIRGPDTSLGPASMSSLSSPSCSPFSLRPCHPSPPVFFQCSSPFLPLLFSLPVRLQSLPLPSCSGGRRAEFSAAMFIQTR